MSIKPQIIRCDNDKDTLLVQMDRRTFVQMVSGWGASTNCDRFDLIAGPWKKFKDYTSLVNANLSSSNYIILKYQAIDICSELEKERLVLYDEPFK